MTFELFYRIIVVTGKNAGDAIQIVTNGLPRFEKRFYHKYCILTHLCSIQNNGIDVLFAKQKWDTELENLCMDTKGKRNWKIEYAHNTLLVLCIKQITNENLLCNTANTT